MNRRTMMTLAKGEEPLLPSEYQQVEWIQTNNACRIDSGVAFDRTKDFCLEAIALIPDMANTAYAGWNAGGIFGAAAHGYWYDGSTTSGLVVSTTKKTKVEQVIYAGVNSNTVTKYTYVSDASVTQSFTRTHQNIINRLALINYPLFAISKAPPDWDYTNGRMRLYEIKLGFDGVFETHLIPCYRKSDNTIGMYDIIKKSFRPNLGAGTFTKGADVN